MQEVKADIDNIAKSTKEQVTTDCLREEMNKQAAQILETVQSEVKEVKADMDNIAKSTKEQVTTDCLREEMNKQAAQIQQTVLLDLSSQSEVVKELQSEVRSLAASLGEMKDMLQRVLQK